MAAEALGITTAALAYRVADPLVDGALGSSLAVTVVVLGGLVEGTALGVVQATLLGTVFPRLRRRRYVVATVLVAGLGWGAASAPSVLAGDSGGAPPALLPVLLGAAALGLGMGAVLGAAQAWSLRGAVRHPMRWIAANAAAWTAAMTVLFVGATVPEPEWSLGAVLGVALLSGAATGAVLGVVTRAYLPSLSGTSVSGRLVLSRLAARRPRRLADRVLGLDVRGRRSGLHHRFPVGYVAAGDHLVVVPGHAEKKSWWRNLGSATPVEVLREGCWAPATASVLWPTDQGHAEARAAYLGQRPRLQLPDDQPVVVIRPASDP